MKGVNETSTKVLRTAKIQTDLLCCSGVAVYERLTGGLINLCYKLIIFSLQEIKSVGQDESTTESRYETVLKRSPSSALSLEEVGFRNPGLSYKSNCSEEPQVLHRCCCTEAHILCLALYLFYNVPTS